MRALYDPTPRKTDQIFSPENLALFQSRYQVTEWQGEDRDAFYARHLPTTDILISQQPMGRDRLDMAANLRVIINVETNLLPHIDYEE